MRPGCFKSATIVEKKADGTGMLAEPPPPGQGDADTTMPTEPEEEDEGDGEVDDDDTCLRLSSSASISSAHRYINSSSTDIIHHSLKFLVSIENAKFKTFHEAMSLNRSVSCSWGEATLLSRAQTTDPATMTTFTERHLLRCYPAGHRVMSDNYDPSLAWSVGAQMVALNFQANDKPTWLNRGKFAANGGCGFIRKPKYLIDPSTSASKESTPTLNVTIVAGSGWENFKDADLFDAPDTYIRVTVTGNMKDSISYTTSTFNDHERTGPQAQPHFNEIFTFRIVQPELALLLFTAYDKDTATQDDFLAQYCIPVNMLRSGVRILPLYSEEGKYAGRVVQHLVHCVFLLAKGPRTQIAKRVSCFGRSLHIDIDVFSQQFMLFGFCVGQT